MKVLFLYNNPIPSPDAGWARVRFFADYFQRRGNEVSIAGAFSYKTFSKAGVFMSEGVRIINICPVIGLTDIFSLTFNILSSAVSTFLILCLLRPNLVIISLPNQGYGIGSYLSSRLFKRKIVTDYRDEWEDYFINTAKSKMRVKVYSILKRTIMAVGYCRSKVIITVTKPFADSLHKRGAKNIHVVPNGADTMIFRPRDKTECRTKIGVANNAFIITYSGGIADYYRLDILVRAFTELVNHDDPNSRLLMVGQRKNFESILQLIDQNSAKEKIICFGEALDKEHLAVILSACDIGIIPYDSNPLWKNTIPAKFLEYVACGLPVIASVYRDSLLGKVIVENKLGLVVEPENVSTLYEGLKGLKINADIRNNSSERGPSYIVGGYDRNKLASNFYALVMNCHDTAR